ncbi:acylphosphatase [Agrobacterium larrymoorei]|uniref:Acylphosphatase n=2 Tax=Agrobacterium larrymoorei TaxID=160699 RepID=A0AAJ2EPD5_9HYPH|nr:acylphosphatase [Agrobacterium larrymoorei]
MVISHHQFPAPDHPWDNGPAIRKERMTILGSLDTRSFLPWINRHAAKLGLEQHIQHADQARIELILSGPVELIDAMEMGCSLGPINVWVEDIQRAEAVDQSV